MVLSYPALGNRLIAVGKLQVGMSDHLAATSVEISAAAEVLTPTGTVANALAAVRSGALAVRTILGLCMPPLQVIVDAFSGVTVPTISFSTTQVNLGLGTLTVVTGINLGNAHPLVGPASSVAVVRTKIGEIRDSLNTIASAIADLRDSLPAMRASMRQAATRVGKVGIQTKKSGETMIAAGEMLGGS